MKKMFATLATLVLALTLGMPALATAQEGQTAPATQSKAPTAKNSKKAKKPAKQASTTNGSKPATATSGAAQKQ